MRSALVWVTLLFAGCRCVGSQCVESHACRDCDGGDSNDDAAVFDLTPPRGCWAPAANLLYVDPQTRTPGAGSADCPLTILDDALQVASSGTIVAVRGGASINAVGKRQVPAGVTVTGGTVPSPAPGPFTVCDTTSCADPSEWPLLKLDGVHHGFLLGAGSALRFFRIDGQLPSPSPAPSGSEAGVYCGSSGDTPSHLEHLRITRAVYGIEIDGGRLEVDDDVQCDANWIALEAEPASDVAVVVADGQPASSFDGSFNCGILVNGNVAFSISGPVAAAGATPQVSVSYNREEGVRFFSHVAGSRIDGLGVHDNGLSGLHLLGGSTVVVRDSHFFDNLGAGVFVESNGTNRAVDGMDLGADTAAGAGRNQIYGNGKAGICIETAVAKTAASLLAQGNDFTDYPTAGPAKDCTVGGTLSRNQTCNAAVDVSDNSTGFVDVASCN